VAEPDRKALAGTTWDVYLYILTSREATGVRDLYRGLGFSSPSLAQYHINKLIDLKLIKPTQEGKYRANETEQVDALKSFILLRGRLRPRLVFHGAILTGVLASYLVLWPFRWDFRDLVVLLVTVFSVIAFSFEAYTQYRSLKIK
jgi:hypothetical protein